MEQSLWFIHMDERWMWRWYITDVRGQPLAISKVDFFRREDAVENLETARLAIAA